MCSCVEVHLVFVITAMAAHFSCAMSQCKVAHMAGPPDCMHSRRGHHTGESCLLYQVMPWQQSITPQTLGSTLSSQCVMPFTLLMKHSEKKLTVIIWDMPNSLFTTLWWSPCEVSLRNSLKSMFPDATPWKKKQNIPHIHVNYTRVLLKVTSNCSQIHVQR